MFKVPKANSSTHSPNNRKHKRKQKSEDYLHYIVILSLLIVIINKVAEAQYTPRNTSDVNVKLNNLQMNAVYMQVRCKKRNSQRVNAKRDQTQRAIILLLLILSNDIHPNPGPKPPAQHCSLCKQEISEEDSLKCDTCSKSYHVKCTSIKDNIDVLQNSSFQWICPNLVCKPNHREGIGLNDNSCKNHENTLVSPNRYQLLDKIENKEKHSPAVKSPMRKKSPKPVMKEVPNKRNENYDQKLMKDLPKISPKDYKGKDLCRSCCKEVKSTQQAISCDMCKMWIHRVCSDMNSRRYTQLKTQSHFQWICNKCRKDETLNCDRADVTKLDRKNQPDTKEKITSHKNEMLILNMNCRSLLNKSEEIEKILKELDPDIVCLTETWFDNSVPAQGYIPSGYKIIRKDRNEDFKQKYGKNKGGGIAILYKSHLKVEKKDYMTDKVEEILWVHVKTKQSFMLGTIYRPEYTDIMDETDGESKIEENIRKASEISDRLIITGDLNIDTSDKTSNLTKQLKNIYNSYNLTQLVEKTTRIDKSGRQTIIDHVWADEDKQLINQVGTFVGISDHLGTYIRLNMQKPKKEKKTIRHRSYRKYDPQAFRCSLQENLAHSNIQHHLENRDVNSSTEELIKIIKQTADEHAPMMEITVREDKNYIPWYSKDLCNMITQKNELISDYYYYGLSSFNTRIKEISNRIKHLKRKLKKNYISEKLAESKDNPKKCWNIINLVTNRSKTKDSVEPDNMCQNKANRYNKYFATIGEEIQKNLKINVEEDDFTGLDGFTFKPETEVSIDKLIDRIKKDVATGADEVGAKILKDAKEVISPILAKVINLGYQEATFPDCMKIATIKALHKKEDSDNISNYRPISILPTLSKVFERAATDQLVEHLEKNNLLSKHQHAYRKGHSTQTCLVEVINYLYKLFDHKKYAAVISLDLSKAFDSISHQLMLNKLARLNLSEPTLLWIKSYLSHRKQRTKFKSYISTEEPVTAGVPQGSIIGPLLFLCFTNDIPEVFTEKCKIVGYADDTQLLVEAADMKQLMKKIEDIIETAQKWYSMNSMKNNISKTEVLILNTKKVNLKDIVIKVKDGEKIIQIKPKSHIKILGVLIDDQLNWTKQVNNVKRNALNSIRNLHRVNHLLPTKLKVNLYNALVTPHLDYADVVWAGCGKSNSQKLQIAQNFAAKSITGNKKYDSASDSLRKLQFLNLHQRRTVHEAVYTHKSLLQLNPANTNADYLQHRPTSNTRSSTLGKLNLPKHRTSKFQNSPLFRTIKSWNSCPDHISTDNIKTHKSLHQKYLITETYKH